MQCPLCTASVVASTPERPCPPIGLFVKRWVVRRVRGGGFGGGWGGGGGGVHGEGHVGGARLIAGTPAQPAGQASALETSVFLYELLRDGGGSRGG